MSEYDPNINELPHMDSFEQGNTYLDRRIAALSAEFTEFYKNLDKSDRERYKLFEAEGDPLELAGRVWGQYEQTIDKSADLKSLRVLRLLGAAIMSSDPTQDRDVPMFVAQEYWRRVDVLTYRNLGNIVRQDTGISLPEMSKLDPEVRTPLCAVGGYVITRYEGGNSGMAHYTATPVGNLLAQN